METRYAVSRAEYARMNTAELRRTFLLESLFAPGEVRLVYGENERVVVGAAVPADRPLRLEAARELAAAFFCERREAGVLNLGGPGRITTDGTAHPLAKLDLLYVGRGTREVVFESVDPADPARFYFVSYPAHAAHPTTLIRRDAARKVEAGVPENANRRVIRQYVHPDGAKSSQLVMGYTELAPGSVWNTMPPHTHARRTEVYLYFGLGPDDAVFHCMGPAEETRHLVVRNEQAVLSPMWSIHSGCGTRTYSFVWAMGGENQAFTDMDGLKMSELA